VLLESLSEREFGVSYRGLSRIWPERPVLILRKVPPPLTIQSEKRKYKNTRNLNFLTLIKHSNGLL
jgi:hypothetical protein